MPPQGLVQEPIKSRWSRSVLNSTVDKNGSCHDIMWTIGSI